MLLALGQANGKVVLTTFGPSAYDALGLTGLELSPKHLRQCNAVAWNPIDSNLLVSGLDKYRSDFSIQLWDTLKCPIHTRSYYSQISQSQIMNSSNDTSARPIIELCLSEAIHSLAWVPYSSRTILVGSSNKYLKLLDLRVSETPKGVQSVNTKAVFGVAVAPFNDHHVASFVDNTIAIWDMRHFDKPVLPLAQNKHIIKISWCPTRHNLLGSLQRDSSAIHLHDLQQSMDKGEATVLERSVRPGPTNQQLTSFSWHPKDESRLLTISMAALLTDYCVVERITLNWSPSFHIVWTIGRKTLKTISSRDKFYKAIDDISLVMCNRAKLQYGLIPDLGQNGNLDDDDTLKSVWRMLSYCRKIVEDKLIPNIADLRHPGVRTIFGLDRNTYMTKSEATKTQWTDNKATAKVYHSLERDVALQLCGWKLDKENPLEALLEKLEVEEEYARGAAIATFYLNLNKAIDLLNKGASNNPQLSIVAMALAGFSDDRTSTWKQACLKSKQQLKDPYLKAIFSFLTVDNDNYESILMEKCLNIEDRVGFACRFLSDSRLIDFLTKLTLEFMEDGKLNGLLLTGCCKEAIPLLLKYLDNSGDIQTVSIIVVRTFPPSLIHEDMVLQDWINSYRNLLDSWRLWVERAKFDILVNATHPPPQQVFISCNFCKKSISAYLQGVKKGSKFASSKYSTSPNKHKVTSCPYCRKPQPRCAVCLINMGTSSTYITGNPADEHNLQLLYTPQSSARTKADAVVHLNEFGSWFTWCQICRHGGHAAHIISWFTEHKECPVSTCSCQCLCLDAANQIGSISTSHFTS